jgi:tetratricopeptide (TPR) repeat protein
LGVAYLRTDRPEPARELLTTVVQMRPENDDAYQYLGYCYLRLNDVDKSIASYEKAIEVNDKNWQAYRGLGVAYMLRAVNEDNKLLKAKAVYQWRLSLDIKPDQPRRERLLNLIKKYTE